MITVNLKFFDVLIETVCLRSFLINEEDSYHATIKMFKIYDCHMLSMHVAEMRQFKLAALFHLIKSTRAYC
jgi:hypothetical protein